MVMNLGCFITEFVYVVHYINCVCVCVCVCVCAVSYTHLDVYKRQAMSLAVATAPAYRVSQYSFKNVWHFPRRLITVDKSLLAFCMVLLTKFT